jgi:hypothetical protein
VGGGWGCPSSNEVSIASPRGDNSKRVKKTEHFKKIFSRTSQRISIKLSTNHLGKGISILSNKGSGPL